MLNIDVGLCCWIDCLGRQVRNWSLVIDEVKIMIQCHLEELDPIENKLATDMNLRVLNTINQCQNKSNVTSAITLYEIEYLEKNIYMSLMKKICFLFLFYQSLHFTI